MQLQTPGVSVLPRMAKDRELRSKEKVKGDTCFTLQGIGEKVSLAG